MNTMRIDGDNNQNNNQNNNNSNNSNNNESNRQHPQLTGQASNTGCLDKSIEGDGSLKLKTGPLHPRRHSEVSWSMRFTFLVYKTFASDSRQNPTQFDAVKTVMDALKARGIAAYNGQAFEDPGKNESDMGLKQTDDVRTMFRVGPEGRRKRFGMGQLCVETDEGSDDGYNAAIRDKDGLIIKEGGRGGGLTKVYAAVEVQSPVFWRGEESFTLIEHVISVVNSWRDVARPVADRHATGGVRHEGKVDMGGLDFGVLWDDGCDCTIDVAFGSERIPLWVLKRVGMMGWAAGDVLKGVRSVKSRLDGHREGADETEDWYSGDKLGPDVEKLAGEYEADREVRKASRLARGGVKALDDILMEERMRIQKQEDVFGPGVTSELEADLSDEERNRKRQVEKLDDFAWPQAWDKDMPNIDDQARDDATVSVLKREKENELMKVEGLTKDEFPIQTRGGATLGDMDEAAGVAWALSLVEDGQHSPWNGRRRRYDLMNQVLNAEEHEKKVEMWGQPAMHSLFDYGQTWDQAKRQTMRDMVWDTPNMAGYRGGPMRRTTERMEPGRKYNDDVEDGAEYECMPWVVRPGSGLEKIDEKDVIDQRSNTKMEEDRDETKEMEGFCIPTWLSVWKGVEVLGDPKITSHEILAKLLTRSHDDDPNWRERDGLDFDFSAWLPPRTKKITDVVPNINHPSGMRVIYDPAQVAEEQLSKNKSKKISFRHVPSPVHSSLLLGWTRLVTGLVDFCREASEDRFLNVLIRLGRWEDAHTWSESNAASKYLDVDEKVKHSYDFIDLSNDLGLFDAAELLERWARMEFSACPATNAMTRYMKSIAKDNPTGMNLLQAKSAMEKDLKVVLEEQNRLYPIAEDGEDEGRADAATLDSHSEEEVRVDLEDRIKRIRAKGLLGLRGEGFGKPELVDWCRF